MSRDPKLSFIKNELGKSVINDLIVKNLHFSITIVKIQKILISLKTILNEKICGNT